MALFQLLDQSVHCANCYMARTAIAPRVPTLGHCGMNQIPIVLCIFASAIERVLNFMKFRGDVNVVVESPSAVHEVIRRHILTNLFRGVDARDRRSTLRHRMLL